MPVSLQNYYSESSKRLGKWVSMMRGRRNMSREGLIRIIDLWLLNNEQPSSYVNKFNPNLITFLEQGRVNRPPFEILDLIVKAFDCTAEERAMLIDCITPDFSPLFPEKPITLSNAYTNILTDRECEVIRLGSEGLTSREIGKELCLTKGGVDTHWHNIRKKLNANTREQAIATAIQWELV